MPKLDFARTVKSLIGMVGVLGLTLVMGCADSGISPLSSGPDGTPAITQTTDVASLGHSRLMFSSRALFRSGKPVPQNDPSWQVAVRTLDERGGKIVVQDWDSAVGSGDVDDQDESSDLMVRFEVRRGGLPGPVEITMGISGDVLSDLVVAFNPDGLEFLVPAALKVRLRQDRVDLKLGELEVLHAHDSGKVDKLSYWIDQEDDYVTLSVLVSGFSEFTYEEDDDPDEY